jgi:protein-S-isoprenylcysteine O-methyltransferase Ste14
MEYAFLALVWLLWCFCHSALISMGVTGYLKQRLGDRFRYYRLAYNGFSLVTLIPVALYAYSIRSESVFSWEGSWRIVQVFLLAVSLFLFLAGGRHYDGLAFLGLRQFKDHNACMGLTETCEVDTRGILGVMRHPWYAGGIMIIWARDFDVSAIVTNVILTGYFIVGTLLEERKLSREFPEAYKEYQQKVSMLFPYQWLKSKWKKQYNCSH